MFKSNIQHSTQTFPKLFSPTNIKKEDTTKPISTNDILMTTLKHFKNSDSHLPRNQIQPLAKNEQKNIEKNPNQKLKSWFEGQVLLWPLAIPDAEAKNVLLAAFPTWPDPKTSV